MLSPVLLGLALAAAPPPPADSAHLVVVATTDVHGHATDWDYLAGRPFPGGLVRAATVVDSLRARYPGQVLLVDVGDLIQGDPFALYFAQVAPRDPHPVLDAMNRMGYDAATPGNHEFNFGLVTMRRALDAAAFPYVSANIREARGGRPVFRERAVLERAGVRVGVTGFTTPGVMVWDREVVRGAMVVEPIARRAARVLRDLRRRSDLVIVLSHSGIAGASSYDTTGVGPEDVSASLAAQPDRPDLVVVGHSHRQVADTVIGGVHFVQPRNWAQSVTVTHLHLRREGGRWRTTAVQGDVVPLAGVAPSERIRAALAPAHAAVQGWVATPIGRARAPMPAATARMEPTPFVNFINAVQREAAGADLSATAAFSVRARFDTVITLADVAAAYPYENTLRAVRISGDQLRRYLEQSARYWTLDAAGQPRASDSIPGYNFDIVSGVSYDMDLRQPPGRRITRLERDGRPVAPGDSFTLALNSYRQAGGGGFGMLAGAPVVYDRDESVRDLLVAAIRRRGTLDPADYAGREWRLVPSPAPAPGGAASRVRVLAINDFHGALAPRTYPWSNGRPVGGAAALAAAMDSAAAACGCPTVRLDGGDQYQGTLASNSVFGRSTVEALNAMGIAAAAIGNHEFDWGIDTLRARLADARYPWLSANLRDSVAGRRPDWVRAWAVVAAGPLRVGVVGYSPAATKSMVKADRLAGYTFAGPEALAGPLDSVRATRPDLVVLVAHEGAFCDSLGCRGEVVDLARQLPAGSVDLIVSGHTHTAVNTVVNGIPIVQARTNGTTLGVVDLEREGAGPWRARIRLENVYADAVTPDARVAAVVDRYQRAVDSIASRPVATLAAPLTRTGAQHALGNLIADAQRAAARADLAVMNSSGIRADLPAGPVTFGQLFAVQPFGNGLSVVTLPGAVVRELLERAVRRDEPAGHVSGVTVTYDPTRPEGQRIVDVRLANGRRLDPKRRYTVAVNDYLAGGGSGYTMLLGHPRRDLPRDDLSILADYLGRRPQPVRAPADLRIREVQR